MAKILLIAYSFPPIEDPQALRWYYYVKELVKQGFSIDILTINCPFKASIDPLNNEPNIKIFRIFPGPFEYLALKSKHAFLSGKLANPQNLREDRKFIFLKKTYHLVKKIFSYILPGDHRTEWFPFVLYFVEKLNSKEPLKKRYQLLLTSHEPAVCSLLGLYIKKRFNLKWVADFGDPYVCIYTPKIKQKVEQYLERIVYKNADGLIFTNNTVIDELHKKYEFFSQKKVLVLYQGYDKELLNCEKNDVNLNDEDYLCSLDQSCLNIFYAGTFYPQFRDPTIFIKAIKELNEEGLPIKFYIAGRNDHYLDEFKKYSFLHYLGYKSHKKILAIYKYFDLLVYILNKCDIQIPGKFFEYLGTTKPILCIGYNEHKEIISILKETGVGWFIKYNVDEIKSMLKYIFELKKKGIKRIINLSKIEYYSYENQSKILSNFLIDVLKS
ncbi:MAG: hypothetical protein QXL14_02440 [Candidatus Aenigmatarchaeota archaeon]